MSSIFTFCLRTSWETSKRQTLLRLVCTMIQPLLAIGVAYAGKALLNIVTGSWIVSKPLPSCYGIIAGIFLLNVLSITTKKTIQYCQRIHGMLIDKKMSEDVMHLSMTTTVDNFDRPDFYDELQLISRDMHVITETIWNVTLVLSNLISLITVFTLLCKENILISNFLIIASLPAVWSEIKQAKVLYDFSVERVNLERQKGYFRNLAFDKRYAAEIRLNDLQNTINQKHSSIWSRIFQCEHNIIKRSSILTGVCAIFPLIPYCFLSIALLRAVLEQKATIGDYSLYTGLAMQLQSTTAGLIAAFAQVYDNRLKIKRIMSLLSTESKKEITGNLIIDEIHSIEFRNVWFRYPQSTTYVLANVSFKVETNDRVLLWGENGTGKTTLIKLLLRMYPPTQGSILINGIDINQYNAKSLYRSFSVYFQNAPNYCMTLRENITLGNVASRDDDHEIESTLRACGCQAILDKLMSNLELPLTRYLCLSGLELSEGQNQKVALARTLFKRFDVLILDEPTSNMDLQSCNSFIQEIRKRSEGKLLLFVSHDLQHLSLATKILVLNCGRLECRKPKEMIIE